MPDPLDVLRGPDRAIDPPADFARTLRRRLAEALTHPPDDRSIPVSTTPLTTTEIRTSITPYLSVRDAAAALAFYTAGFGARVTHRIDMPDGRIGHAEFLVGDARVMLADEYPEMEIVGPATLGNTTVALHLEVPDVDAFVARAMQSGATLVREVSDQFHGNRNGVIHDPFGHRWMVSTPIESLTAEEVERRAAETFGDDDS